MTAKRFNVFLNRIGNWIIEDVVEDKYLINIPEFLGFDDEETANLFCNLLNSLNEENEQLKGEVAYYKLLLMSLEKEAKRITENWKVRK